MKVLIISASHRPKSESLRVSQFLARTLSEIADPHKPSTSILNLAESELEFWDESFWSGGEKWAKSWPPVRKSLAEADAFIFVVPEWHGSVPSRFKNLLLLAGPKEMGHKPALIVTLSSSRGGALPVSELRASTAKNARFFYLPEQLIVRQCQDFFKGDESSSQEDTYLRERAQYCLKLLVSYASAVAELRKEYVGSFETYPNGMS